MSFGFKIIDEINEISYQYEMGHEKLLSLKKDKIEREDITNKDVDELNIFQNKIYLIGNYSIKVDYATNIKRFGIKIYEENNKIHKAIYVFDKMFAFLNLKNNNCLLKEDVVSILKILQVMYLGNGKMFL